MNARRRAKGTQDRLQARCWPAKSTNIPSTSGYVRHDGSTVWVTIHQQRRLHPDGSEEHLSTVGHITALKRIQEN